MRHGLWLDRKRRLAVKGPRQQARDLQMDSTARLPPTSQRDQASQWIELSDVCGLGGRTAVITMWYAVALMKLVPTMFPATMPEFTREKLEERCKSIYRTLFVPLAFFYCSVGICPSSRKSLGVFIYIRILANFSVLA